MKWECGGGCLVLAVGDFAVVGNSLPFCQGRTTEKNVWIWHGESVVSWRDRLQLGRRIFLPIVSHRPAPFEKCSPSASQSQLTANIDDTAIQCAVPACDNALSRVGVYILFHRDDAYLPLQKLIVLVRHEPRHFLLYMYVSYIDKISRIQETPRERWFDPFWEGRPKTSHIVLLVLLLLVVNNVPLLTVSENIYLSQTHIYTHIYKSKIYQTNGVSLWIWNEQQWEPSGWNRTAVAFQGQGRSCRSRLCQGFRTSQRRYTPLSLYSFDVVAVNRQDSKRAPRSKIQGTLGVGCGDWWRHMCLVRPPPRAGASAVQQDLERSVGGCPHGFVHFHRFFHSFILPFIFFPLTGGSSQVG